jgi:hypothetical protein
LAEREITRLLFGQVREEDARYRTLGPKLEFPALVDTVAVEEDADRYIASQVARAKLERANMSHRQTLQVLTEYLQKNGYQVEYSRLVDAYCRLKTGPAIFEVKSITEDNERAQCRHALSQLYEYRYLYGLTDASLWLVLSRPPQVTWIVEYLMSDRNIELLWVADGELGGPSAARLPS